MTATERASWTPVLLGFVAFLLAADLAGPLSPALGRVLLALTLAAIVVPVARRLVTAPLPARLALFTAPVWPLLLVHLAGEGSPTIGVFVVVVTLAASAWTSRGSAMAPALAIGAQAVALAAIILMALRYLPIVWSGFDVVALAISRTAGLLSGAPVELGPTFAGVWVVLLYGLLGGSLLAAGGWRAGGVGVRVGLLLILCFLVVVAYAGAMPWVEAALRDGVQALVTPPTIHVFDRDQPTQLAPGSVAALGNVLLVLVLWLPAQWLLQPVTPVPFGSQRRLAVRALAALAIVVGGSGLMERPAPSIPAGATIGFYDEGTLDFSKPEPGRYGLIQAGMYGGTRQLLDLTGYDVTMVSRDGLEAALDEIDALVVINIRESFDDAERDAIWSFVRSGGGLLVMGDHTDLFGIMGPLNHLLDPIGTRFIFDSAFPLRSRWQHAVELRPHPITAGAADHRDVQIGTGGSLVLSDPSTRPVVLGRYAFSDFGNRLNDGQGGLLGDYRYQIGERLGDVVLVAAAAFGQGHVVVFGDTSTFQVLAVAQARRFVDQVFAYVAGGHQGRSIVLTTTFWVLLALGFAGLLWALRPWGVVVPLALLVLVADFVSGRVPAPEQASVRVDRALALVESSQVARAPYEFFVEGAIGGLYTALYRAGYLPVTGQLGDVRDDAQVGLIVLFAPSEPYTEQQRDRLQQHLDKGGTLLIVADGRAPDLVEVPLALCGMTIEQLPLGPASATWNDEELEMVDAWPLTVGGDHPATIHAAWEGYNLIVETRPGAGRCLAIGDPRFFHDENFEGERQFHAANVPFIDALLSDDRQP